MTICKGTCTMLDELPTNILEMIVTRLSVADLLNLACTSHTMNKVHLVLMIFIDNK